MTQSGGQVSVRLDADTIAAIDQKVWRMNQRLEPGDRLWTRARLVRMMVLCAVREDGDE